MHASYTAKMRLPEIESLGKDTNPEGQLLVSSGIEQNSQMSCTSPCLGAPVSSPLSELDLSAFTNAVGPLDLTEALKNSVPPALNAISDEHKNTSKSSEEPCDAALNVQQEEHIHSSKQDDWTHEQIRTYAPTSN